MLLPNVHIIFEYFPEMPKSDLTIDEFQNSVKQKLQEIYDENKFFLNDIVTNTYVNYRSPLMVPYGIKDDLQDKIVMHIGSKDRELDEGMSYYTKKIYSIEKGNLSRINRTYKCPTEYHKKFVENLNPFPQDVDIFFTWCGYVQDIEILRNIKQKNKKRSKYFIVLPQQEDKLRATLDYLREFVSETPNSKTNYRVTLFDESENYQQKYGDNNTSRRQFPITSNTPFTELKDEVWNEWKIFGNQWGVWLLFEIEF
jgi:hypothetical protein